MPRILQLIPPSSFELIRDRIAEILIEEFNYQDSLIVDVNERLNTSIYSEKNSKIDKEDFPALNICLTSGNFSNKNARNVDGVYQYTIDVYASSPETINSDGDFTSNVKLQKMIGRVRAILENPEYDTLGFVRGTVVCRVGFLNFQIGEPATDTENITFSRMIFEVLANENVELRNANLIDGYTTKIKIDQSNRGYQYKGGNA